MKRQLSFVNCAACRNPSLSRPFTIEQIGIFQEGNPCRTHFSEIGFDGYITLPLGRAEMHVDERIFDVADGCSSI